MGQRSKIVTQQQINDLKAGLEQLDELEAELRLADAASIDTKAERTRIAELRKQMAGYIKVYDGRTEK